MIPIPAVAFSEPPPLSSNPYPATATSLRYQGYFLWRTLRNANPAQPLACKRLAPTSVLSAAPLSEVQRCLAAHGYPLIFAPPLTSTKSLAGVPMGLQNSGKPWWYLCFIVVVSTSLALRNALLLAIDITLDPDLPLLRFSFIKVQEKEEVGC